MNGLRSLIKNRVFGTFCVLLLLTNSAFIAVANRVPGPPRLAASAFFYEGNVLLHLILGLGALLAAIAIARSTVQLLRSTPTIGRLCAIGALAALAICMATGLLLVIIGNLRPQARVLAWHGGAALVVVLAGAAWMYIVGLSQTLPDAQPGAVSTVKSGRAVALVMSCVAVSALVLMAVASRMVDAEGRVVNPTAAPATMQQEGDGPKGKFWPASVQSVGDRFIPSEFYMGSKTCGKDGCHPDIYKQWESSAHHWASFNNQWYRRSIEYMQEVEGVKPSKWCAGCHDMAVLLTQKPGTNQSRFDTPIKDQIWPPDKHPESFSGIGCAACHSTVHTKSTMGNNDYVVDYPPMHRMVMSQSPFIHYMVDFLTRLAPAPHRKTFLKPFHTQDTARFCSQCHKVHLDVPVNNFRWFRGFDEYDAWQASGVSGYGARSFYYPNQDGKPAFKSCADCHMALAPSQDAGNLQGMVHSHRFIAANTALPYVNHDQQQLALTQKFLRDGALSIDIFALRREGAHKTTSQQSNGGNHKSKNNNAQAPEGSAASLFGDVATTGSTGPLMPANVQVGNEQVVAPINRGVVAVQRGTDALIDVVVRTRKVGHAFPGGTFDASDVWVELQARDERGKVLFWSGNLQWPQGPVDPSAHYYRAVLLDAHGNQINKRNAWAARARVYAHAIPPGAADTIHYRLHIPPNCGNHITVTAKLNYRKFSWWNTQFSFAGSPRMDGNPQYSKKGFLDGTGLGRGKTSGPVTVDYDNRPMRFDNSTRVVASQEPIIPDLPITTICQDAATLEVVSASPEKSTAPRVLDRLKDRERWNDYGIGLMLQGDFARATRAFNRVIVVAPKWPEGYVNVGRVTLNEGDLATARTMFERALAMYAAPGSPVPPALMPYLRARTQFFYGQALKNLGLYDQALAAWTAAATVFPDDRELRNQTGRLYFQSLRFSEAVAEFQHVTGIDPEDLTANYNLMLCYRALGPQYASHEKVHRGLYYRFKDDESQTHIAGPYKIANPYDNIESIAVHEHSNGPAELPAPPKYITDLQGPNAHHNSSTNLSRHILTPARRRQTAQVAVHTG